MKSRTAAALAAVSLVLVSCSSGASPQTLELSSAGSNRDAAKGGTAADTPLYAGAQVEYVPGTEEWGEAGSAHESKWPAWSFDAPTTAAGVKAAFAKVVSAFGMDGNLKKDATTGTWQLADKSADLTFDGSGDRGMLWWNVYGTSLRASMEVPVADCPEGADCAPPDSKFVPTTIPAARRISAAEAEEKAMGLLAATGADVSDGAIGWTTSSDEYGAYAYASHMFQGVPSGMGWSFSFGADGVIVSASGSVFSLVRGDDYPVIDIEAAIKRLNEGFGFAYAVMATREVAPSKDTGKQSVKIMSATMSVAPWWTKDGGQVLLPAYDFVLEGGSHVSVVAVADKYVKFAGASDGDVPAGSTPVPGSASGGSSGSGSGSSGSSTDPGSSGQAEPVPPASVAPVTMTQAETLIGLTLAEAQKVCDGNGWTLRVASLEGKENMLTMEWQPNRVNVDVLGGKITAVSVG